MGYEYIGFLAIGWGALLLFVKAMVGERQRRPWSATPEAGLPPLPTRRQLEQQAMEEWDAVYDELDQG